MARPSHFGFGGTIANFGWRETGPAKTVAVVLTLASDGEHDSLVPVPCFIRKGISSRSGMKDELFGARVKPPSQRREFLVEQMLGGPAVYQKDGTRDLTILSKRHAFVGDEPCLSRHPSSLQRQPELLERTLRTTNFASLVSEVIPVTSDYPRPEMIRDN